jgi:hypothetical protein
VCVVYIYAKIIQKNGCISCSSPFAPAEDNSDAGGISSEFAAAVPWLGMGSMAAPKQADSPFIRFSFDTHYQKKHVRNFGNFFIRFYTRMVLQIILIFFSPALLLGEIKLLYWDIICGHDEIINHSSIRWSYLRKLLPMFGLLTYCFLGR